MSNKFNSGEETEDRGHAPTEKVAGGSVCYGPHIKVVGQLISDTFSYLFQN